MDNVKVNSEASDATRGDERREQSAGGRKPSHLRSTATTAHRHRTKEKDPPQQHSNTATPRPSRASTPSPPVHFAHPLPSLTPVLAGERRHRARFDSELGRRSARQELSFRRVCFRHPDDDGVFCGGTDTYLLLSTTYCTYKTRPHARLLASPRRRPTKRHSTCGVAPIYSSEAQPSPAHPLAPPLPSPPRIL